MRGASKEVQARIKEINKNAIKTHCYAHNLNRALVNATCDTFAQTCETVLARLSSLLLLLKEVPLDMHTFCPNKEKVIPMKPLFT